MKANELMIGDWVLYDGEPNIITEVSEIIYRETTVCFVGNNYMANIDEIEPIPLTPEILEKNWWVCESFGRRQEWWLDKTKFPIVRYSTNDIMRHGEIILKYVHQLQQALRLCGIEKTIKL